MKKCILLIMAFSLFIFACEEKSSEPPGPIIYNVKYEVTGNASTVDITMENEQGGTSQYADIDIPWDYEFTREEGSFVYLSAQNQGEYGSVIVTIYRNGEAFKSSTSNGAYVIATASGIL